MKRSRAIKYYYGSMMLMAIGVGIAARGYFSSNDFLRHLMIISGIMLVVVSIACYVKAECEGRCPHCRRNIDYRTQNEFCPKCGGHIPFDQEMMENMKPVDNEADEFDSTGTKSK